MASITRLVVACSVLILGKVSANRNLACSGVSCGDMAGVPFREDKEIFYQQTNHRAFRDGAVLSVPTLSLPGCNSTGKNRRPYCATASSAGTALAERFRTHICLRCCRLFRGGDRHHPE